MILKMVLALLYKLLGVSSQILQPYYWRCHSLEGTLFGYRYITYIFAVKKFYKFQDARTHCVRLFKQTLFFR